MKPELVLASQSPRRRELLGTFDIPFSVVPPDIEEIPCDGESPEQFVIRMAREKGIAVASRLSESVVLSADTVVAVDGEILGKPVDEHDAIRMLQKLSGRQHSVYTAVCLIHQTASQMLEGVDRTDVWFNPITELQIRQYLGREHVLDKAGAYAIQGFAAIYVSRIEGSYSNVIGLPLPLVYAFLSRAAVIDF